MAHTIRNKAKLLTRVNRIVGQLEAVKRSLEGEAHCGEVLRLIASSRGAINGLMAEVLEGHLLAHAFQNASPGSEAADAAQDVIDVVRSYLK